MIFINQIIKQRISVNMYCLPMKETIEIPTNTRNSFAINDHDRKIKEKIDEKTS